jgi:hypothetical protein
LLDTAEPDGGKCIQKACPFPSVINGECRQHAMDRRAHLSLMCSTMNPNDIWLVAY